MALKNKEFCRIDSMCGEGKYCNTNTNYCISTDPLERCASGLGLAWRCGEGEICKKEQDEEYGYCVPGEISWNIGDMNWKRGIFKKDYVGGPWEDYINTPQSGQGDSDSLPRSGHVTQDTWYNKHRGKRSDIALKHAQGEAERLEQELQLLDQQEEQERQRKEEERQGAEKAAQDYASKYPRWSRNMPFTSETNSFLPSARAKQIEKDRRESRQNQDPFAGVSSVSSWGGKLKQNKNKRKITKRNKTKRKLTKRNKTKRNKTKRKINK